ncbi:lysine--tRNA ligase [Sediminispirochaeta smaragdinae]|jgi:lysyl-tRNA synthetase class 1|uniref:Lysine--tRNA ligase n=1 Tax=Sediminispirochaeta smaragdinae (strain DSM 11293 / JCM 15392 / SEBR 4228) TaxID=573413 RepID=E1R7T0_SEDSS|nr:lysine--tRNA ligase [Sediminispirochaeta smaragdinae]ADK82785.1 lysyl-tRNA synthetase [Sediminispirochaeta smaragdinae DSM 11293]
MSTNAFHWADVTAEKIIRERGDKEVYTCASGITPSGTVHIGNFREIISVELVVRALRERGKKVRFIYSWDDYDVFRKVPKNMPKPELLETYLRKPITIVPDTSGRYASYAEANEKELEALLPGVGVEPEYIYQASRYRSSYYAEGIRQALEKRDTIRAILNEHRTSPLPDEWWPVSVFSTFTDKDTTTVLDWDGEWGLRYRCDETGKEESLDLRTTAAVKLPWRVDWPMRWALEGVDFEPAGKDHHSEGGSFDTARKVVEQVYGGKAPVSFQYDFIRIKGRGGKISSSSGEVIALPDVLEVYQPEIVRYLFAGTRPNAEFAISFDLDVLKIYEDYDKCERVYFGVQEISAKKADKEKRIYELSQVSDLPGVMPYQVPLRHLCNLLQVNEGDIEAVLDLYPDLKPLQRKRLEVRCRCAWNWITTFSPEDFRFSLRKSGDELPKISDSEKKALSLLRDQVDALADHDEKSLAEAIYAVAEEAGLDAKELFTLCYQVLIGKEKGPRLASFILTVGRDKILAILDRVLS